ncbi:MAG: AraC family transcriptional regulator [Ruminococcus sp.]|nr:AraC family transcriptional regulator [Ruminococcus sp.]
MEQHESNNFKNKLSKRIIGTPSPTAKSTFFYMQETGCLKPDDAASTQRRNLDSFLFVAVVSGRGELIFDNETFSLGQGDCFFIDCRVSHNYRSSADDPWEVVWIHFNGSTSEKYYEYFISQSKNVFCPTSFERVAATLNDIISTNELQRPDAEVLTSKMIVDLLTLALTSSEHSGECTTALNQKLAAVHAYIEENFSKDLSLEKISSEFYISKYYLTREYKKIYGKTIFQHIIMLKINYAKHLLRFSDMSIEEIAHLCGFNDQSYFARQFKKSENMTCFAYRKKWRD